MGDSDKLEGTDPARYSFLEHRRFLETFIEKLGLTDKVVLVGHDWGGALAMDWAFRHSSVRGITYFETSVRPRNWDEISAQARSFFERIRSAEGEQMALEENLFVEKQLPQWILRPLSEAEMSVYRRPFLKPGEDRRPTLTFPRELLIGGTPEHMVPVIGGYSSWMAQNDVPKLFINGDPGAVIFGEVREFCRRWKNQKEVTVRGRHYLQEDSPYEIGNAIVEWLSGL
jgi:haloalkane dehalogenase